MDNYKIMLLRKLDLPGIEAYLSTNSSPRGMLHSMFCMLAFHQDQRVGIMDYMCKTLSHNGIEYALVQNRANDESDGHEKTSQYWYKRLYHEMNERDKFLLEQLQDERNEEPKD